MTDRNALYGRWPQAELHSYTPPWYDRVTDRITSLLYGENANAQQRAGVNHLVGPENPLNLPAQLTEGYNTLSTGVSLGEPKQSALGALQMAMALPFGMKPAGNTLAKAAAAEAAAPKGIRAYHGSPHDFDRFDLSKIGSGEGAQAYGHGLYFAGDENVARYYRDQLTGNTALQYDGVPASHSWNTADLTWLDHKTLRDKGAAPAIDEAITRLRKRAADDAAQAAREGREVDSFNMYASAADRLSRLDPAKVAAPGRMYEVRINAEPEQFLDWDKPLSQQSDFVRSVFARLGENSTLNKSGRADDLSGRALAHGLPIEKLGLQWNDSPAADKYLREAGIPGIRYKDQGSRGTDGGTHNYVVFDDKLIEILRKYGLAGLMAGGAAAGAGNAEAAQ